MNRAVPAAEPERLRLCLYIAGDWPNSHRAVVNLREMLVGIDVDLEVVDVLQLPDRGMHDGIFVTPTLVRLGASPKRIVGDLSNRASVLEALLPATTEPA